jgi:hypothetical protein
VLKTAGGALIAGQIPATGWPPSHLDHSLSQSRPGPANPQPDSGQETAQGSREAAEKAVVDARAKAEGFAAPGGGLRAISGPWRGGCQSPPGDVVTEAIL